MIVIAKVTFAKEPKWTTMMAKNVPTLMSFHIFKMRARR
jgi:hypothetical protein